VLSLRTIVSLLLVLLVGDVIARGDEFVLKLREQREASPHSGKFERTERQARWPAAKTAVIVCDVWDYHHCLNAVKRLEEFAPRLNQVLAEARRHGATIIHSPSDCMDAYTEHPARRRALSAPAVAEPPRDIQHWCSRIPREELAAYPIDQSDGGEDDDPAEHRQWAAKLKELGRNPGMPWKRQSEQITIDDERDYISDRGDEVWNILTQRGIEHVILTGVHVNMCVLGRPFGLRQLARHGKQVVLMRDMTDSMYNPQRWPYVDHFTGTDLVISHIERYVCPTITSDQVLGGQPFQFKNDQRSSRDVTHVTPVGKPPAQAAAAADHWSAMRVPSSWKVATHGQRDEFQGVAWYRCAVRMPRDWLAKDAAALEVIGPHLNVQLWCNGRLAEVDPSPRVAGAKLVRFMLPREAWTLDEANLLVLRIDHIKGSTGLSDAPVLSSADRRLVLKGGWQFRLGDQAAWSNIPLPAKFGIGTDYLFEP